MSRAQQLEARIAEVNDKIAAERQTVADLRRLIDARRPIPDLRTAPGASPTPDPVPILRAVLAAHQNELTRALTRRDSLAGELALAKRQAGGRIEA
jgi:chorismate mutase